MIRHHLLALATASTLLLSSAAQAEGGNFYLYGHLGQAMIEERLLVSYEDDSDTSVGVRLGWEVNGWLGVEVGYSNFGEFQSTCCVPGPFQRLDYDTTELGLRGRWAFGDSSWYGVGRAGVHRWDDGTGRGSRRDTYYGVGVGYRIDERFSVGVDYDLYQTDNAFRDVDRVGVGVEVAF